MSKLFRELGGSETDKIEAAGQKYKDSKEINEQKMAFDAIGGIVGTLLDLTKKSFNK